MVSALLVGFVTATAVLYLIAYMRNPSSIGGAVNETLRLLLHPSQGFLYIILAAFFMSSVLVTLLPTDVVAGLIGRGSGVRGVLIATVAGALTPGGPALLFPVLLALYRAGAAIGPLVAYITSWSLLGFTRILAWEVPLLGAPLVVTRLIVSVIVPIVLGLLSQMVYDVFFG